MNRTVSDQSNDLTIGETLATFYTEQGIPADGGMSDKWVKLRFGRFYLVFPNMPERKKTVRYHDVHHLLTGYSTSWKGEASIGAYEVAAGCGDYRVAWILDLPIFALGLFIWPKAIFKAFIRGRRASSFYHHTHTYEQILEIKVSEARAILRLDTDTKPVSSQEIAVFIWWWLIASVFSMIVYIAPVALVVCYIIFHHHK